jgi:hypothetical protein
MTIYDLEIPDNVAAEVVRILKEEEGETVFLPRYTRILTEYYLKYIRPDKAKAYRDFNTILIKFCHCPRCVNQVWDYWRKRLKIVENEI